MLHSRPSNHAPRRKILTFAVIFALVGITALAMSWSPITPGSAAGKSPEKRSLRARGRDGRALPAAARLASPLVPVGSVTVDRTDDPSGVALVAASVCSVAANDCSLRGAVAFANANPGTTINVPAGTYNLTIPGGFVEFLNGDDTLGDLDITASGTSIVGAGAATTIIHQTQAGDRPIEVNPFLDAGLIASISNVTISGGSETTGVGGGGILSGAIDSVLTLTNCIVSGNSATGSPGGGGIQHWGGSLNISGCTFSSNSTDTSGGAVSYSAGDPLGRFPSAGTLAISGSTFSNNTASSTGVGGGALDLFDFNLSTGTYTVSTSSFNSNHATGGSGGAIIVESGGPLSVTTSSFANNNAAISGGAILAAGTVGSVRYSRLVGNSVPVATNGLTIFKSSGTFAADDNWWGSNVGPGMNHFRNTSGTGSVADYLKLRASASPNSTCSGGSSTISADIKQRQVGVPLTVELNGLPPFPATFVNATPALGTLSGASANFVDGAASATFTASGGPGTANIDVTADSQTVTASISIGSNSTSDPADQTLCAGGTATFSTTASGPGPITFTWKKGATVLNNGDLGGRVTIVSGPTSSTLTISNVQASDADTYTVEAAGACSTASQSATLTVNSPTTTTDPPDQTVCEGAMVNFSTTAGGTGPFSYAWTLDGNPYNGNSASISIDTTGMSGTHTVSVTTTGACNSASQSATLTVQANTTTTDPPDQTVCEGATASFSTTAGGTGPFSYAWTVDGNPAGTTPSINVNTTGFSAGPHTVSVTTTGTCGTASQSATLTVQANTTTTDPPDQTECQGAMANFSTTAGGTGPFSYAWTLDGNPYNGNSASISIDTTSLSVGSHSVSVTTTGTCGSASQSATLTVQATTTTTDPADQSVCEGATANFSTTAGGQGPFSYVWTLDGNPYNGNSASISVNTTGFSQGAHTVTVTTTGSCGSASQSATLTVNNSPPVINVANALISVWPPNHQYQNFTMADFGVTASSSCDGDLTNSVVIVSVTSDELDDNPGGADGNTINDIVIAADCKSVQLRRERDGGADGRVYTVTFMVTDSVGHTTTATARVVVPLNENGGAAVDSGPHSTVNGNCP